MLKHFFVTLVVLLFAGPICADQEVSAEDVDNGGLITNEDAFVLKVDGNQVLHGAGNTFAIGVHIVSQDGLTGYQQGIWGGDCESDGSITLELGDTATCTVINDDISPTLTVVKTIINDNGGAIFNENAFGLNVDGNAVSHNQSNDFNVGTYTVSEIGLGGYLAGDWGGSCDANGVVTLSLGQNAVCTIINDDIAPTLKVVKTIISDNGGEVQDPNAFGLRVDGNSVQHNAVNELDAGNHTVSEDGLAGYLPSNWSGNCNADGTITLTLGQVATCNITNDDSDTTNLTLIKQLIKDNGGTASGVDWILSADGPTTFGGPGPNVSSGVSAGVYNLSESSAVTGYSASAWVCVGGTQNDSDTITLALGESAICTITNDDISPQLTVVNTVNNNFGGVVTNPNAFGLRVSGVSVLDSAANDIDAGAQSVSADGLAGYLQSSWGGDCASDGSINLALGDIKTCTVSHNDISPTLKVVRTITNDNGGLVTNPNTTALKVGEVVVQDSAINDFDAGNHLVSESGLPGYQSGSWGGDCDAAGLITLVLDQDAVCTITNDDISPTLTINKTIVNDNGGTITNENLFDLKVSGVSVLHGASNAFDAGSYTVSETSLPGYVAGDWGGGCDTLGNITLALGQDYICNITNDDTDTTSLSLEKVLVNDNGGTASAGQWTLDADGPTPLNGSGSGVSGNVSAGTYILSESGGPAGYNAGVWVCDGGEQNNNSVTLAPGDIVSCTITNDDISPTLTINKTIVNDNGGTITNENLFDLNVGGVSVLHGASNAFDAGSYTVSETSLPGYVAGDWGGACDALGNITLALGQDYICNITNNDSDATSLSLGKVVVNDNGGDASAGQWTLDAAGPRR